jgi:hypothetical protein
MVAETLGQQPVQKRLNNVPQMLKSASPNLSQQDSSLVPLRLNH